MISALPLFCYDREGYAKNLINVVMAFLISKDDINCVCKKEMDYLHKKLPRRFKPSFEES